MKSSHATKSRLRELQVRPRKERGQNFVIDPTVIDQIVKFGAPSPDDTIVEVGPGLGALTERLTIGRSLTLIEIEPQFCRDLSKRFPSATIINQDVRHVDFSEIGSDLTVFGNIPYVFSTDIVFHLVHHASSVTRAVLLLQREFAERVGAKAGGKSYGILSIMAQIWSDVALGPIIPGTAFHPAPAVESRLLELRFHGIPKIPLKDPLWFRRVVHAAFHQRRKKIHNSLKASNMFPPGEVDRALTALGFDPGRRAETFTIDELARLADELKGFAA